MTFPWKLDVMVCLDFGVAMFVSVCVGFHLLFLAGGIVALRG